MKVLSVLCGIVLMLLTGCTTTNKLASMVWATEDPTPKWTAEGHVVDGGAVLFVGMAEKCKTLTEARDRAMKDADKRIFGYLSKTAKDKLDRTAAIFGLTPESLDTTPASGEYEKRLADKVVSHARPVKWYIEQWETPEGEGWKACVLVKVPVDSINGLFRESMTASLQLTQKTARETADGQARNQAETAAKFWEEMARQGGVE